MRFEIGRNIRQIRQARGMTLKMLADRTSDLVGQPLTASLIGAWQRGDRRVSSVHLIAVADALGCSVCQLYGRHEELGYAHHLSDHERQIVRFAFDEWDGDVHPLLELMGLYMGFPSDVRAELACTALYVYTQAIRKGIKPQAPYEIRIKYLQRKYEELIRR